MSSKEAKKLTNLPRSAAATGAAWSPDGTQLLYAQFWRRPGENASGADLMIVAAGGGNPVPFAERDAPSTVLDTPVWSPSGHVYFTIRQVQAGREHERVVRMTQGGTPETVVDDGYSGAVTADEAIIVWLHTTKLGQELRKRPLDQPGDGCVLVPDTVFQALSQPRISPDGKRVAFGGSGDPAGQASACGGTADSKPAAGTSAMLLAAEWFGLVATPAYAHGLPSDVWVASLDGGPLTRAADVKEDEPTVAWSPDGSHLAVFGVAALYVADAKGGPVQKLVDQGGYGGLDWR